MSQCKWCNKKGLFLQLTVNGVCNECNPAIVNDILENGKKFEESIEELNDYTLPQDGLNLISIIKNSLSLLKQYEVKGIPTIDPFPSELLNKKIYGKKDESLYDLEKRLIQENIEIESGVLRLSEIEILGSDLVTLNGKFVYDDSLDAYVQKIEKIDSAGSAWTQFSKISLKFSDNHKCGIYREYYESGNLRRETPFIIDKEYDNYLADGIERVFYEGYDDVTQSFVYNIHEENSYKNGTICGKQKKYYTNGKLMYESLFESFESANEISNNEIYYKKYHLEGGLAEEVYPGWGKAYYDSGELLASWKSNNYAINGEYIENYPDGPIKMKVNYIDGNRDGLMHKYFEDGRIKELWSYDKGKRKFVKKYYENGELKTEWLYNKNGKEISKKYFDKQGHLIRK